MGFSGVSPSKSVSQNGLTMSSINTIDTGKSIMDNALTMKTDSKIKIMEKLYGDDRRAAAAVGVSWHAWRRWRLGERKISVPVNRLIDRLITEKLEQL